MLKSQELPYKYKSPFMRLYYQLYLNKKNLECEEFLFFLKECIIPDFDHRTITKQVNCLINDNAKENRLLIKSDEYWQYLKGGQTWNCSKDGLLYIILDLFKRKQHGRDKEVDLSIGNLVESLEHASRFIIEIQIA